MTPFDVVVVGGGLCGATVAGRLSSMGVRCALLGAGAGPLDSGPASWRAFTRGTAPLTMVDAQAWAFRGGRRPIEWMRVRAAGGRTLLWGGWMVRPEASNLADARALGRAWPISFDALDRMVRLAERRLSVRNGRAGELVRLLRRAGAAAGPKRASVGPGGGRPLYALDVQGGATLFPRTVALRAVLDREGRAQAVECVDPVDGRVHRIEARAIVLAASAIESARILHATSGLELERLGHGLVDHMYCGAIAIVRVPPPQTEAGPLERAAIVRPERCASGLGFSIEARGPGPVPSPCRSTARPAVPANERRSWRCATLPDSREIREPCRRHGLSTSGAVRIARQRPRWVCAHGQCHSRQRAPRRESGREPKSFAD